MRCWYELGDKTHPHFVQDYEQLQYDASAMREHIIEELKTDYPARKRLPDGKADALAELLVTALLADYYSRGFNDKPADFVSRSYDLLPKIGNTTLLCYMLVLLFWLDEPTNTLKTQIDSLMSTWKEEELTPEDKYVKELYEATKSFRSTADHA